MYNKITAADIAALKKIVGDEFVLVGDEIRSITVGGKTVDVTRGYHLIDAMIAARVGDTVKIDIVRSGEQMSVEIPITESVIVEY